MMDNHRQQDFPLNDALQEVLHQGETRARELRDAQQQLHALQASLLEADQSWECVCSAVSLKEKQLSVVHCDTDQVRCSIISLNTHIESVLLENLRLTHCVEEQREHVRSQRMEIGSYRAETHGFRSAVSALETRALVHQELQQKQQEVCVLEEMKTDLQNPDSSAVRQTQKEIDFLKANIKEGRRTLRERKAQLEEEQRTHTRLRREIEIQQRRCEAVLKRLRSQLMKAQSGHWRLRSDVTHLEQQLRDLQTRLEEHQH
ncbi:coiled-coil domain-containing protein 122 [Siphateles boraxobius]|uniref:coiled-coil domain-containing protein 122 n=1 Tax=Siphateles boraxobius TaxID=180520 RepID=UPI004063CDB9